MREGHVTVEGRRVRYLEAGAGWPLVLIHAFPMNADMWRPQLEQLPSLVPDARLIVPDLIGFGPEAREEPPALPSMDDYARQMGCFIDAMHLDTAVIGGLSMGGYVSFALYRQSPERFSGLVLADTRPQADTPEGAEGRRKMIAVARGQGTSAVAEQMIPKLLGATTQAERPDVVREVRAIAGVNPSWGVAAALDAMRTRADSTALLATISCPVLLVAGEEDTITPVAEAEAMHARLPRSHLVAIARAGHLSNLEAPAEFSRALADFMASHL